MSLVQGNQTKSSDHSSVLLYSHPSMTPLAEAIVRKCAVVTEQHDQHLKLERQSSLIPQRTIEFCRSIEWGHFPDGFPNLFISDVKKLAGKDVIFLGSFHSPTVIFEQLSLIYSFPRYLARSFKFILPYFPTGTMERVDTEGQIATAKTLARLLSQIPLCERGPAQIVIYDIHALQERFYFSESVIPRLESAIPLILREIRSSYEMNDVRFAFPDDGAHKRFYRFFPDNRIIICNKVRSGSNKIITLKEGNPSGKHVIMVDDLVMTGGTLIECAKVLKNAGAASVSAYVTHAVFPCESWKQFTEGDRILQTFWITDSLPHSSEISQYRPFKLLSLAELIADMLSSFDLTLS